VPDGIDDPVGNEIKNVAKKLADRIAKMTLEEGDVSDAVKETKKPEQPEIAKVPEWMESFQNAVKKFSDSIELVYDLRKLEAEEKEKVVAELKQRGSRIGIVRREGEPVTPPKDKPADWKLYGDPANWSWPVDEKGRAQSALAYYNGGSGKEKYSAREWNILGRRIARLVSDVFGVTYTYNVNDKTVERKEKMTDKIEKADMMGLLQQVAKQLSDACEMIGTDPSAAKDMMLQAVAAMDVASDTTTISPSAQNLPINIPIAPIAAAGPAVVAKAEVPVEPQAVKFDDSAIMELLKQQGEMLKTLGETVVSLQKSQVPAKIEEDGAIPLGDLAALLKNMPEEQTDLVKALNEGNLKKAFEAVGNDPMKLYEQVQEIATKQIAMQGINVSRFGFYPTPLALIEEPKQ
jgi:hypothetical protein